MAIYYGLWSDWSWVFPSCPLCELAARASGFKENRVRPHFRDSGANLSAWAEAESLRIFFLKLLKSYIASCVGARRSSLRWWVRVNVCTTWQRSDFCILYFMLQPLLRALTTFPPSNWTAKSKSNLDSQNTHISRHEAYFWPHVEKNK